MILNKAPKEVSKWALHILRENAFLVEGAASAKALEVGVCLAGMSRRQCGWREQRSKG